MPNIQEAFKKLSKLIDSRLGQWEKEILRFLRRLLSAFLYFLKWWNLKNARHAADLLAKISATFAVILAVKIFVLNPKIEWIVDIRPFIDISEIASIYQKDGFEIPLNVNQVIKQYNDNALLNDIWVYEIGDFEDDIVSRYLDMTVFFNVPDCDASSCPYYGPIITALNTYEVYLLQNQENITEDMVFAYKAMEDSRKEVAIVTVCNTGRGTAYDVEVIPKPGYRRVDVGPDVYDIPPTKDIELWYTTANSELPVDLNQRSEPFSFHPFLPEPFAIYRCDRDYQESSITYLSTAREFTVTWDQASSTLDLTSLRRLASLFLGIWFAIVLYEIIRSTRQELESQSTERTQ
jgi:hypothetical protein